VRDGDEVLGVERASLEKADGNCRFKSRTPNAGGVRNECGERPIFVMGRNADDEGWTNLGGHTEIDEPDLATLRCDHLLCSRRSSS